MSAFARCSTELDTCVVGRGVHSSGSKKQHLLKAPVLTCPQSCQSSHPNFTPPSTSFTPHSRAAYGAPALSSELSQKDRIHFFFFNEVKSKLPTSSIWHVKLATQVFLLMTLPIDFQLWCFAIWISQLPTKSASQVSTFNCSVALPSRLVLYRILHLIISPALLAFAKCNIALLSVGILYPAEASVFPARQSGLSNTAVPMLGSFLPVWGKLVRNRTALVSAVTFLDKEKAGEAKIGQLEWQS